jgi:hypothetical protein
MDSAPLWGGFFHERDSFVLCSAYQVNPQKIIARPEIQLPTNYHIESCIRSVVQPYAFERFLKLYHLLELVFDWNLVVQIQNLGNNLQGIGQILNQYSSNKDIERLNKLFIAKHDDGNLDIDKIAACLNKIDNPRLLPKCLQIFFDYSKDSNPYKETFISLEELMRNGGFSRSHTKENNNIFKGISNRNRQFKSEVQQELMAEDKVLRKGFDSQGIFWVCD